jgi:hypothetical protein
MTRRVSRLIGLGLAAHLGVLSGVVAHAQTAPQHPLDDKLACRIPRPPRMCRG